MNLYGGELRALRNAQGMSIQALITRLQLQGWSVGEDTITDLESGRRIVSDSELAMILLSLEAELADLSWPPKGI